MYKRKIERERCKYCEEHRVNILKDRSNEKEVCGKCYNFCKKYKKDTKKKEVSKEERSLTKKYIYERDIRPNILKRDNYKCVECGSTELLCVHHIKKRSKGGDNSESNLQTLCLECHMKKHKGERTYKMMENRLENWKKRQNTKVRRDMLVEKISICIYNKRSEYIVNVLKINGMKKYKDLSEQEKEKLYEEAEEIIKIGKEHRKMIKIQK